MAATTERGDLLLVAAEQTLERCMEGFRGFALETNWARMTRSND